MILFLMFFFIIINIIIYKFNNNINENMINNNNLSCCLIKKEYSYDKDDYYGGNFKYKFEISNNNICKDNLKIPNDNNRKIYIIDKDKCNNKIFGSCRRFNKECIDFVDQQFCDKYSDMIWSNKTCNNSLDFKWIDPIKIHIQDDNNKTNNNDTIILFKN